MIDHLSVYSGFLRGGLDSWTALQLTRKKLGVCEFFEEGLKLGVCPRNTPPLPHKQGRKRDTWVAAYTRAVKGAQALKARDRLNNQSQKLAEGETLQHTEAFPSGVPPYMPAYMRHVLSHVHDSNEWKNVVKTHDGRVDGGVVFFRDSKSAVDCRRELRKLGVTAGLPQKQFSGSGGYAFEINIETIEVIVPEKSDPVPDGPRTVMGEALAQAGLLR